MRSIDVDCPKCKAAPGFKCTMTISSRTFIERATFHHERTSHASTVAASASAGSAPRTSPAAAAGADTGTVVPGPLVSDQAARTTDIDNRAVDPNSASAAGTAVPLSPQWDTWPFVKLACGHLTSRQESMRARNFPDAELWCSAHARWERRAS